LTFPNLQLGEVEMTDDQELLYRQVHPSMVQGDTPSNQVFDANVSWPSSEAFRPGHQDAGCLSVVQGSKTTPKESYEHYVDDLGLTSAGVWAVTVGEAQHVKRRVVDDAGLVAEIPFHAYVDFRDCSSPNQMKKYSPKLRDAAKSRGPLYVP